MELQQLHIFIDNVLRRPIGDHALEGVVGTHNLNQLVGQVVLAPVQVNMRACKFLI